MKKTLLLLMLMLLFVGSVSADIQLDGSLIAGENVSATDWFITGRYDWLALGSYLSFDGQNLTFNETYLNDTILLNDNWINESGDSMTGNLVSSANITATLLFSDDITLSDMTLNTPTYTSINDWFDTTQSSGIISGGTFTSNGDGTATVTAGTGIIRASGTTAYEPAKFFNWTENVSVTLTDSSTNYVYVSYNSGTPKIGATTTKGTCNNRDCILLGKIFREGTTLHTVEAGMVITEATKRTLTYLTQMFGEVARASGFVVAETGNRYLTTTDGVLFAGLTRLSTTAIDTSGADSFEIYYRDGGVGWTESNDSQINHTYWDDGTGTLNDLTANRYGVFWVYGDPDGHLMVLYGQGDYTLALAEASNPPSSLPDHISEFGFLSTKIIIQKSEANLYSISSAYDTAFTPSGAVDHGGLTGLSDDDHTQYLLTDGSRTLGGAWNLDSQALTNVNMDSGDINVAVVNTEWDSAYTHSQDNTQAHTDYLINNGNDTTSGAITIDTLGVNGMVMTDATGGSSPYLRLETSNGHYFQMRAGSGGAGLFGSDGQMNFKISGDYSEWVVLKTVSNIPEIGSESTGSSPDFRVYAEGGHIIIGTSANPTNLTMFSPDGTSWECGVNNTGDWNCV